MKAFFTIFVLMMVAVLVQGQAFKQVMKAMASDRAEEDYFGCSVAISGNYAIVGAMEEDHEGADSKMLTNVGAAYIFERDSSGIWIQVQKIIAADGGWYDKFGTAVAISGHYAIVGAPYKEENATINTLGAGAAYIFERSDSGTWSQTQKIVAADQGIRDWFGHSVAISAEYVIVGSYGKDKTTMGGHPIEDAGAAYLFERGDDGNWTQTQKVVAADRAAKDGFGISVAIADNYALVGAYLKDEQTTDGKLIRDAGAAYLFERDGKGTWTQTQKIVAADREKENHFGCSVALSGNEALIGEAGKNAPPTRKYPLLSAGAAYLFQRGGDGIWTQTQKIVAADPQEQARFGCSVALSGNHVFIGASLNYRNANNTDSVASAGAAYLFQRGGDGSWTQTQKIVAGDRQVQALFGRSVAISGNDALVGAFWKHEWDTNRKVSYHVGAAYFFERGNTAPTSISGRTTICEGSATNLTVVGGSLATGASWKWYADSCGTDSVVATGATVLFSPAATTTYYVRAEEGTGGSTACISKTITVGKKPQLTAVHQQCFGTTTTVQIITSSQDHGLQYSIDGGTTFQNSKTFTNVPSGTYTVVVRDLVTGCTKAKSVTVNCGAAKSKLFTLTTLQITPNPFTTSTNIAFQPEWDEQVTIKVFGLDGREVATLLNKEVEGGQTYNLTFDGSHLPAGVYILHLATESGEVQRQKLVISR